MEIPLESEATWEVEALYLKVFEYCDYSVRSALLGKYRDSLCCSLALARRQGRLVGAAVLQYRPSKASVAIVGPVAVDEKYRRMGIGTELVRELISIAEARGIRTMYLGVSKSSMAARLYKRLGFAEYRGIVMRYMFCPEDEFEEQYFGKSSYMRIRRAGWGDFPGVIVLASFPCKMQAFDFRRSIFSSKYVEPARFFSIFPEMMQAFSQRGGYANVLVCGTAENVVGIAHVRSLATEAQEHMAELDFYVHDNFVEEAELLVRTTLIQSVTLGSKTVACYCPAGDKVKWGILEGVGARQVAVLTGHIRLNEKYDDVLVYQIGVTGNDFS